MNGKKRRKERKEEERRRGGGSVIIDMTKHKTALAPLLNNKRKMTRYIGTWPDEEEEEEEEEEVA